MPNDTFLKLCKDIVVKYFNENVDKTDNKHIHIYIMYWSVPFWKNM